MMADSARPRRDRILAAAGQEFANHGYAGARVERIAAAAGVNKQLLFHYFGSKSGLHRAVLKTLLEHSTGPPPATPKAPVERLRDLAAHLAATIEAHPALLGLLASPTHDQEVGALADDWRARIKRNARQILQDGQRAGYVRDDADIDAIAQVVVGAMLGWMAADDQKIAGRRNSYQETLLKMVMDYCAWR
jgi:AcrR family transcriptional regulator